MVIRNPPLRKARLRELPGSCKMPWCPRKRKSLQRRRPCRKSAIFYLLCAGLRPQRNRHLSDWPDFCRSFRDKFGLDDSRAGLFFHCAIFLLPCGRPDFQPAHGGERIQAGPSRWEWRCWESAFALLNAATFALALAASAIYGFGLRFFATPGTNFVGRRILWTTPCLRSQHHESGFGGAGRDFRRHRSL